jgi:hypothetical protein
MGDCDAPIETRPDFTLVARHPAMSFDPHTGKLPMFLGGLEPEAELVARPAIGGLNSPCRLNGAWTERTESLRVKIVGNDEDKLARVTRAAHDMAEDMTARQKQRKL